MHELYTTLGLHHYCTAIFSLEEHSSASLQELAAVMIRSR
jgi:hypothetical protein